MKIHCTPRINAWIIAALVVTGCSAAPAELQGVMEQVAPTLQAAATDLAPAIEAAVDGTAPEPDEETSEETTEEAVEETAEEAAHEVTCDPADIPLPLSADTTIRFNNASGAEMVVNWRDTTVSPPALQEYARVAPGDTFDQESFVGHEWVLVDHDDRTLEYVVTAAPQQCVTLHHWSYEGETGPAKWAELREEYESCATGHRQSPIDLAVAGNSDLENIAFAYGVTPINLLNNGHTIQFDKIQNNQIAVEDVNYPLSQLHFHAPSEHIEGGANYPLEMHLVHALDGQLAVVGVLIEAGAENSAFAPAWDDLTLAANPAVATGKTIDVSQLLPADRQVYAYSGSLTTPPCAEDVKWFVLNEPITMSAEQIAAFTDIFTSNNRPLQPLNQRELSLDNTP